MVEQLGFAIIFFFEYSEIVSGFTSGTIKGTSLSILQHELVITSYSIHYTKLYELISAAGFLLGIPNIFMAISLGAFLGIMHGIYSARKNKTELAETQIPAGVGLCTVITSYSIHYTKLYDVCDGGFRGHAPRRGL